MRVSIPELFDFLYIWLTQCLNQMKKKLFISYSNDNLNKVKLIETELLKNQYFEALVVANKRDPNRALVDKVVEGIKSSDYIIPILTRQSLKTQWINQEIGYAVGIEKLIIPIVENRIMNSLKGFVHKQNDLPYLYKTRTGLAMREENKAFMICFRQLLADLEVKEGYISTKDNFYSSESTDPLSNAINRIKIVQPFSIPLGTKLRSGQICPTTGTWRQIKNPNITAVIKSGEVMPGADGKRTFWEFIGNSFTPVS